VRFGLSLSGHSPRHYASLAQEAESLGFESIWIPDHLAFPEVMPSTYLYTDDGRPPIPPNTAVYDPWVLLGGMATVTERIRFGTCVFVLPLRHPLITARGVLTVDRLSRGRVTLGAGVGWLKDEFDLVGLDPATRGRRADEIIPLLRRLWSEEVIEHRGRFYDFDPVYFEPKPFQRPIPIEIGGTSPAALRRAGALGDGWIELGSSGPEQIKRRLETVHAARASAGRDALPFTVSSELPLGAGGEVVAAYAAAGVDRVIVRLPQTPGRDEISAALTGFAAEHGLVQDG